MFYYVAGKERPGPGCEREQGKPWIVLLQNWGGATDFQRGRNIWWEIW